MPYVINGVGTWNYGRERVHCYKATCEFCNSVGDLTSYDTTLYFVLVFIPIIPLRKNRILNECPYCRRHRLLTVKAWDAAKNEAMNQTLEKIAKNPEDNVMLGEALLTATRFQDEALFERIAALAVSETEDVQLQHLLGDAFGYFSRREEADVAYRHALRTSTEPAIAQSAAMNSLRMGDHSRAIELLEFVTKDRAADSLPYLLAVQDSLQSQGLHEEALALMDKRDAAFPEFATDPALLKARKQSEKHRGTGKKLKTLDLMDSNRSGSSTGNPARSRLAKWVFPIILAVGFLAYCSYSVWLSFNHPMYLVNGTPQAYSVRVHGQDHQLPPFRATRIRVPEGAVTAESDGHEPVTATLEESFWSRPFSNRVAVFNPDRVAVIEEETTVYSQNPQGVNSSNYHIGEGYYSFKKPDYVFEQFPAQIQVKGTATVTKTRVGITINVTPLQYVSLALKPTAQVDKSNVMKSLCRAFPEESLYLQLAVALVPQAELEAFFKPGLAHRPLRMEWHRVYQSHWERSHPEVDLIPEYTRINDELKSGDSQYLLARVMPDSDANAALLKEAAEANPPSAYAMYSLAYRALAMANSDDAVRYARLACEKQPKKLDFNRVYLESLWAKRDYRTYREAAGKMANQGLHSFPEREILRAGVALNDAQMIQEARTMKGLGRANAAGDPNFDRQLNITEALARGDDKAYLRECLHLPEDERAPESNLIRAILEGDLPAAERLAQSWSGMAIVSLAYRASGNVSKADAMASQSAKALASQGRSEREMADMMEGRTPLDHQRALNSILKPEDKRLVLLLVADKIPGRAAELRNFSGKLDVQRDEVSLVLKHIRESKTK